MLGVCNGRQQHLVEPVPGEERGGLRKVLRQGHRQSHPRVRLDDVERVSKHTVIY